MFHYLNLSDCLTGDLVDVISGVDALVKTMKKGEISVANCDSSYAFGEEGRKEWGIKPSSNVKYEVHLKTFEQLKQPWELSVEDRIEGAIFAKKKGTEYYKVRVSICLIHCDTNFG